MFSGRKEIVLMDHRNIDPRISDFTIIGLRNIVSTLYLGKRVDLPMIIKWIEEDHVDIFISEISDKP